MQLKFSGWISEQLAVQNGDRAHLPAEVAEEFAAVIRLLDASGSVEELRIWRWLDYRDDGGSVSVRLGAYGRLLICPDGDELMLVGIEDSESGGTCGD
jgi:hypothetical protein